MQFHIVVCATFVLLFLTVLGVILGVPVVNTSTFITGFWPEGLGFLLEGMLFVGVLGMVQKIQERHKASKLRKALFCELSFLSEVIQNCLRNSKLNSLAGNDEVKFDTHENTARTLENLRKKYQQNADVSFEDVAISVAEFVQSKSIVHLDRLRAMTPVAAEFGGTFLSNWMEIHDALYAMTRKEPFPPSAVKAFGRATEAEYVYSRVAALYYRLDRMGVPPYQGDLPPSTGSS